MDPRRRQSRRHSPTARPFSNSSLLAAELGDDAPAKSVAELRRLREGDNAEGPEGGWISGSYYVNGKLDTSAPPAPTSKKGHKSTPAEILARARKAGTAPGMGPDQVARRAEEISTRTRNTYSEAETYYDEMLRLEKAGQTSSAAYLQASVKYYTLKGKADIGTRESAFWTSAANSMAKGQAAAAVGNLAMARASMICAGGMLALAGQTRVIPPELYTLKATLAAAVPGGAPAQGSGYGGSFFAPGSLPGLRGWQDDLVRVINDASARYQANQARLEAACWSPPDPKHFYAATGGGVWLVSPQVRRSSAPSTLGDAASDAVDEGKQTVVDKALALTDVDPETVESVRDGAAAITEGKGAFERFAAQLHVQLPNVDIENHPLDYAADLGGSILKVAATVPVAIGAVVLAANVLVGVATGTLVVAGAAVTGSAALVAGAGAIAVALPAVGVAVVALVVCAYLVYKGISWLLEEPPAPQISDKEYLLRYERGEFRESTSFVALPEALKMQARNVMRAREAKRTGRPAILEQINQLNQKLDPPRAGVVEVNVPPTPRNPDGRGKAIAITGSPKPPKRGGAGFLVAGAGAGFLVGGPPGAIIGGLVGLALGKSST